MTDEEIGQDRVGMTELMVFEWIGTLAWHSCRVAVSVSVLYLVPPRIFFWSWKCSRQEGGCLLLVRNGDSGVNRLATVCKNYKRACELGAPMWQMRR